MIKHIDIYEAAYAILKLPDYLDYKEPVGSLTTSAIRKLKSCIEAPFVHFGRAYKYWYIHQRAAAMFYFITKSHSLENGNKRSAVIITMSFLVKNGKWMNVSPDQLYNLACEVAKSPAKDSERVIDALSTVFKEHMQNF